MSTGNEVLCLCLTYFIWKYNKIKKFSIQGVERREKIKKIKISKTMPPHNHHNLILKLRTLDQFCSPIIRLSMSSTIIIYYSQFHWKHCRIRTRLWCAYVALFVADQIAVPTFVPLLARSPRDGLHADLALQAATMEETSKCIEKLSKRQTKVLSPLPAQMFGDKGVVIINVQFCAFATPPGPLCDCQRHNEMPMRKCTH